MKTKETHTDENGATITAEHDDSPLPPPEKTDMQLLREDVTAIKIKLGIV